MNEIVINKHNFEMAKERLKEFSEKDEAELAIDRVKTEGGFLGLGDHKVTGDELNNRIETIQKHLIDINTTNNKTIKEFREIYNALDALDKDYMTSIVASVKAIEKTSNDVRIQQGVLSQHSDKLQEQQNKLDVHQGEIDKIIDNIKKTITVLKSFKEKLDGLTHLTDIDKIWADCKTIQNDVRVASDSYFMSIKKVNKSIQENIEKIDLLSKESYDLNQKLEEILDFVRTLEKIVHLQELDEMWDDLSDAHDSIKSISCKIEELQKLTSQHQNEINQLLEFMEKASALEHLMDIDDIWNWKEEQELHLKEIDRINEAQDGKLDELVQKNREITGRVSENADDIRQLNECMNNLNSMDHLRDVDGTWQMVEKHSEQLIEIEKQNSSLVSTVQKNKEDVEAKIADGIEETNSTMESLAKKIKYAYWMAGGAIGVAIIELVLLLL